MAGLAALALAGCGTDDEPEGGTLATLAPADASVYTEFVLRPEGAQREALESSLALLLDTGNPGGELIDELNQSLAEEEAEVSYQGDIEPWLGERGAILFTELFPEEGADPAFGDDGERGAIALDVTDANAAQALIDKAAAEADTTEDATYEDVEYTLFDDHVGVGLVGDRMVIADEETMQRVVDTESGAPALADEEQFNSVLEDGAEAAQPLRRRAGGRGGRRRGRRVDQIRQGDARHGLCGGGRGALRGDPGGRIERVRARGLLRRGGCAVPVRCRRVGAAARVAGGRLVRGGLQGSRRGDRLLPRAIRGLRRRGRRGRARRARVPAQLRAAAGGLLRAARRRCALRQRSWRLRRRRRTRRPNGRPRGRRQGRRGAAPRLDALGGERAPAHRRRPGCRGLLDRDSGHPEHNQLRRRRRPRGDRLRGRRSRRGRRTRRDPRRERRFPRRDRGVGRGPGRRPLPRLRSDRRAPRPGGDRPIRRSSWRSPISRRSTS